jgi:hypothetical protein
MTAGLFVYFVLVAVLAMLALAGAALLVRGLVRTREAGPPAWWATLIAATVVLAIPAAAVATYLLLPAPVSARSLANSIEHEVGSGIIPSDCSQVGGGSWRCSVFDAQSSGTAEYLVTAGWSCWHARRTRDDAEVPMPRRPEGCATLRDALGLFDRVLN